MEDESLPIEADKVVALPLDELALLVLRDAKARGEWNWRNGVGHFRSAYAQRPDALQALAEAWSWLQSHGLIAGNYAQLSADAIMISRRGNAVLESGLGWLRAVERLDVDLVPVLEHKARPQFLRGDFETAAFVAMKEVEVQVRSLPVSLTAPAPSGSPGTTRLCRGWPGSPGALLHRGPLRTVHARSRAHGPGKPLGRFRSSAALRCFPPAGADVSCGCRWRVRGVFAGCVRLWACRGGRGSPPRSPSW